jgi:4-amino-4-deoxy-L-arabinose transferase-like glycosyltransferase
MMQSRPGAGSSEPQARLAAPAPQRPPRSARADGRSPASPAPNAQRRPRALKGFAAAAIFLLAIWPRMVGLETFVTTDEIFWVGRSGNFARALAGGRLALTSQTGHPGVTTMWVGLLGMGPERGQRLGGDRREVSRSQVSRSADFLPSLAAGRRAVALATAVLIAGATLLGWRLLGGGAAVLGGALFALDPFYLAHSQLLHIDALLGGFMAVALLAGLVRWLDGGGYGYLVISALTTGLALLSKSPALFLVGFLPLAAVVVAWRCGRFLDRQLWGDLLTWVGLAAVTYIVCWPALWVAPLDTLRGVFGFVADNANPRHSAAEGGAPSGALFYPAVFALRSTPLMLVGLALLAVEAVARARNRRREWDRGKAGQGGLSHSPSVPLSLPLWGPVVTLLAYALLFGLVMTFAAKSFDRYLLPAFPALDLLAGLGLALSARRLRWIGGAGRLLAGAFLLPLLVYPLATSLPYALTWYNPLAGGGSAAQAALAVGWGEGLDQVARYLNARPNAERLKVTMPGQVYTTVLDSQFVGQVMPAEGGDPSANDAAYFVTYVRGPQEVGPPLYDASFQSWQPELVVRLAGLEYARVYYSGLGVPIGATFSGIAGLEGYGLDTVAGRPGRPLNVKLFWRALGAAPAGTRTVLTLTDPVGREVARSEAPFVPPEPGQARPRSYQLSLSTALTPGEYLAWVALETAPGRPVPLAGRPSALAAGAPEDPLRAVLRSIQVH